ncbi:MAG: hypothetical protein SW833_01970 [Cyanobacteriota bacterium]|nr:hypothetical protein [Cyanobacteriota bacterium]
MTKPRILQKDNSYFELTYEPDDILTEFGYSFSRSRLTLPQGTQIPEQLPELRNRIERTLPVVTLTSEAARRETLVAPILLEIAVFCQCQLKIEYPLKVNQWLKGNLDYLLRSEDTFVVIEAKHDDLARGFTQLAVELIALSEWDEKHDILYGAVTIGEVWQFGQLDRKKQRITQDLELFKIPGDLKSLVNES